MTITDDITPGDVVSFEKKTFPQGRTTTRKATVHDIDGDEIDLGISGVIDRNRIVDVYKG